VQHTDLGKNLEIIEWIGGDFSPKGVALGGFGNELASCVFVEYLEPAWGSVWDGVRRLEMKCVR
jgi:hypothetical protein